LPATRRTASQPALLALCLAIAAPAAAGPSGADLLAACRLGADNAFTGTAGMMCQWYVHACDCSGGRDDLPRVCLPEGIATEQLAGEVVTALDAEPGLQALDATLAVHRALTPRYPCTDAP
jgi:hypothetical protein